MPRTTLIAVALLFALLAPAARAADVSVAVGESHTCAVRTDGTAVCWGRNSAQQTEVPAVARGQIHQITANNNHTCVIILSGLKPVCWGADDNGATSVPDTIGSVTSIS